MAEQVIDTLVTELAYKADDEVIKKAEKALDQLEKKQRATAKEADKLSKKQLHLKTQLQRTKEQTDKLKRAKDKLTKAVKSGNVSSREVQQLKRVEKELKRATRDTKAYRKEMGRLSLQQQRLRLSGKDLGTQRKDLSGALKARTRGGKGGGFRKGLNAQGGQALGAVGLGLGAAAVPVAAVGAGVLAVNKMNSSLQKLDETAKKAKRSGLGAEEFQRLNFAADLTGTNIDDVGRGVRRLNVQMLDVEQGGGAIFKQTLSEAGISLKKLQEASSATERLGIIGDELRKIQDESERTAMASRILGEESGPNLASLLEAGSDGLRTMANQQGKVFTAEELAKAEAYNDEIRRVTEQWDRAFNEVFLEAAPKVTQWIQDMVDGTKELANMASNVLGYFADISDWMDSKIGKEGLLAQGKKAAFNPLGAAADWLGLSQEKTDTVARGQVVGKSGRLENALVDSEGNITGSLSSKSIDDTRAEAAGRRRTAQQLVDTEREFRKGIRMSRRVAERAKKQKSGGKKGGKRQAGFIEKGMEQLAEQLAARRAAQALDRGEIERTDKAFEKFKREAKKTQLAKFRKRFEETGELPPGLRTDLAQLQRLPNVKDLAGRTQAPVISVQNRIVRIEGNEFAVQVEGGSFPGTPDGFARASLGGFRRMLEQELGKAYPDFVSPERV